MLLLRLRKLETTNSNLPLFYSVYSERVFHADDSRPLDVRGRVAAGGCGYVWERLARDVRLMLFPRGLLCVGFLAVISLTQMLPSTPLSLRQTIWFLTKHCILYVKKGLQRTLPEQTQIPPQKLTQPHKKKLYGP